MDAWRRVAFVGGAPGPAKAGRRRLLLDSRGGGETLCLQRMGLGMVLGEGTIQLAKVTALQHVG